MAERFVIAIPEPFPEAALAVLDDRFEVRHGRDGVAFSEDELIAFLRDADAVAIYSRDRYTRRVLEASRRLRVIAKGGSKPSSNVDLAAAADCNIRVLWTPGANAISVAETTILLILALARRLPELTARIARGGWRGFDLLGDEIAGRTLGLVGFGAVGREVAKRYRAFGGPVIAFDPNLDAAAAQEIGVQGCGLDDLLRRVDIVSLHCEMNAATRNLIAAPQLAAMKRGALLVNTARGGLIDEDALRAALDSGHLGGCALDVFATEPPPAGHPLLSHPRVLATPHVAAFTHESIRRESGWALEDAALVLTGRAPVHFNG